MIIVPDYRGPTLYERIKLNTERERNRRRAAEDDVDALRAMLARQLVHGRTSDADIRSIAERRAELFAGLLVDLSGVRTAAGTLEWLNAQLRPLQGRPFAFAGERPEGDQLRGFIARARCPFWWRRCLRRAAVLDREREANERGEVSARRRQVYVTDDTAERHRARRAATAAMLEATELENDAGQVMTLAQLVAASTSNKAIRRGELMTRIVGCERLADHFGMRGLFLTLTAPSRFHRVLRAGQDNPRHEAGATPRAAHEWLCSTWAKARAAFARRGLEPFGFRVAEPHHDGCPHWHALLWIKPGHLWRLVRVIKRWWLKDAGDERGARGHRVKAVLMRPGGAAGYVAKYVAKNIDDAGAVGVEGHRDGDDHTDSGVASGGRPGGAGVGAAGVGRDTDAGRLEKDSGGSGDMRQGDLFGGTAQRVEAWASAWGIRQFQAIGQPPVTVWRELRRIDAQQQQGATPRLRVAFEAVNREGERRADWAAYVLAQGGLGRGRDYLLRIAAVVEARQGRYETAERAFPRGVFDATGPGEWHLSNRRQWKPRGTWSERERAPVRGPFAPPAAARPWTRVNNCTHLPGLEAARRLREAGLLTSSQPAEDPPRKEAPWKHGPPSR